ncbi:ABC transporter permease [Kaustia mangrovi]|uniref:ABC transporter permease n=1 Tax=Kaustia mangrovi TaxID=2593653 RepID=A0A7S8C749_9HYPH|nr:ABC transporter permease [Kaustia mangrovi]QPC44589.1 ABC transporter permease [Kaustia mangrovi]
MTEGRFTFARGLVLGGAWTVVGFLVLPMLIIFPVSLTDQYYLSMPKEHLSFRHYENFFSDDRWLAAFGQSVFIGLAATVCAVILGTLCAVGCWRIASNRSELVRTLMLTPIIVPQIVQALAFYKMWITIDLIDSYLGVILAHTLIALPYVVITVSAALSNFDVRLEQAARNLGASVSQTVRWVIVPCIMPGVLSGALFAFTISFDEIVTVLFITSRNIYTLPKRIWDGIQENLDPTIAAVATALVFLTLLLLVADMVLRSRRERRMMRQSAAPADDS